MTEETKPKVIIIAHRDIRFYLGECLISLQRYDQIVLSAGESFVEKQRYIAHIMSAVGVKIDDKYLNEQGKIKFISEEKEMMNESTGRREMRMFHKLGLTKIPDLFMYTDSDKAVEVPPLREEEDSKA